MSLLEKVHKKCVFDRRVNVLSKHFAGLIPADAKVLDVGCGDGLLAHLISQLRPDLTIFGIDVVERKASYFPVTMFDGKTIPYPDKSFDVVIFVDVLHHTSDPGKLLREASRIASERVLIKDHCEDAFLGRTTLLFMDWIGNIHQGVALPYNYWSKKQWLESFNTLKLEVSSWKTKLDLYPKPASYFFDRSLHFIADLEKSITT